MDILLRWLAPLASILQTKHHFLNLLLPAYFSFVFFYCSTRQCLPPLQRRNFRFPYRLLNADVPEISGNTALAYTGSATRTLCPPVASKWYCIKIHPF